MLFIWPEAAIKIELLMARCKSQSISAAFSILELHLPTVSRMTGGEFGIAVELC